MKRLFSLIAIVLLFSGCSEEVSVPAPGFQAMKDDVLWRADDFKAYIYPDGHMRLVGFFQNEQVELNVADTQVGSYYTASTDVENWAGFTTTFNDEVLHYLTYDALGPIPSINNPVLIGGTGYSSQLSVPTSTLGGGTGMRVDTTVDDGGRVKAVTISMPGSGYEPGDIINISGGNNNAKFKILSEIRITEFDENGVTGIFRFTGKNAVDHPFANQLVSFQQGAFYHLPVVLVD